MAEEGGFWGMVQNASGVNYSTPAYANPNQYQTPAASGGMSAASGPMSASGSVGSTTATQYQSKAPTAPPPMTPAYYSPVGGYPSQTGISNIQSASQNISLGTSIPSQQSQLMSYSNPATNVAIPFSDLQAFFYPYTGKELRTTSNITTEGYTLTVTKYGKVNDQATQTATPTPIVPTIRSGQEASIANIKEVDTRTNKDFKDIFSALGLTSEQFAARSKLAQEANTPIGGLIPSKNFGRSSDFQGISDQLDRLAEAGKGSVFYLTAPFTIAADIGRATAGRTALFVTQLATGQREAAIKTAENFPTNIAITSGVIAGGAVQSLSEAAKGTPAAVGGLFLTPVALHGLGEFAKSSPLKATYQERVTVTDIAPGAQGTSIRGTVENIATSGGREVATVEQFNQIIFKDRTVQPSTSVNFEGSKYIVQEQPITLKPEVASIAESKGFQQSIAPAMTSAAEKLGIDFSRTIKGSFAENVQPVKTTSIGLTEAASGRLEAKMASPLATAAYDVLKTINALNPPIEIQQALGKTARTIELASSPISRGEGALGGGGGYGTIGGKEFASVGISRFELKEPSASQGALMQSYVAQSMLTKGGEAKATGTGLLIMPKEVASELLGGTPSGPAKIARINDLLNKNAETGLAYERSLNFNEIGAEALKNFQKNVASQIVGVSESARGGSLSALIEARNTALDRSINAARPTLTLGYSALQKGGFATSETIAEETSYAPKITPAFKFVSGGSSQLETGIDKLKTDIKISTSQKISNEVGSGQATGIEEKFNSPTVTKFTTPGALKPREDINDYFKVEFSLPTKPEEPSTNREQELLINKLEEVFKIQNNTIFIPGLVDIFRESGPKIFPPGGLGGGGALGEKTANVKDALKKAIGKQKNYQIIPRADPFTAVVSQLRTGMLPRIQNTPKVRLEFKREVLRNPLLTRFGGKI